MANRIFPTIAPFIRAIFGQDDNDDFRVARVDYNGGLFAGAFGAYNSVWNEWVSVSAPSGGSVSVNTSTVPSGYLYVAQIATGMLMDATPRLTAISKIVGSSWYMLARSTATPAYGALSFYQTLVLAPGECLNFSAENLASGASLIFSVCGYKVRLT